MGEVGTTQWLPKSMADWGQPASIQGSRPAPPLPLSKNDLFLQGKGLMRDCNGEGFYLSWLATRWFSASWMEAVTGGGRQRCIHSTVPFRIQAMNWLISMSLMHLKVMSYHSNHAKRVSFNHKYSSTVKWTMWCWNIYLKMSRLSRFLFLTEKLSHLVNSSLSSVFYLCVRWRMFSSSCSSWESGYWLTEWPIRRWYTPMTLDPTG